MRCCGSLLLLLGCVCVYGVPLSPSALEPGNCLDPYTLGAAEQALTEINQDRRQGYVYSLHRLSNAHHMKHGPTGVVFYLTLDFVETKCHVLSKRVWKNCGVRQEDDMPVYGQCKAIIYMNKVKRISKLLRYSCLARSVPASRIIAVCPDCPSATSVDDKDVLKTVEMALEKYNKESGNANYFRLLNITRASLQSGIAEFTFADFIIQETVCANTTDVAQAGKCGMMDCEFAHKGHCSASYFHTPGEEESVKVDCDIFEPEGAEKEKQRHLLGGEHGHAHNYTHEHLEDHEHTHGDSHEHDHAHGHGHVHHDTHKHDHILHHDGTREGDHAHDHAHEHSHEHTDDHTHNHTHDHAHKHVHQPGHAHDEAHDHIYYYGDHHHHHHHHDHGNHTHAHVHDHNHAHNHTHEHTEDHEHTHGDTHEHDHTHGHGHVHYDTHKHDHIHHHDGTREGDHAHDHAHEHSLEHTDGHTHNHIHDHAHKHVHQLGHANDSAHDHIHYYGGHHHHHHHHHHGNHTHAHVHDHDHEHNHTHLHKHEHHHHHHDHDEEQQQMKEAAAGGQLGQVQVLQPLPETPVTMPSFPDQPELERAVAMPSLPEEKPEEMDPPIHPDPSSISPQCLRQPSRDMGLISQLFDKDPLFKPTE